MPFQVHRHGFLRTVLQCAGSGAAPPRGRAGGWRPFLPNGTPRRRPAPPWALAPAAAVALPTPKVTARQLLAALSEDELRVKVTVDDFRVAREGIVPSVSPAEVRKYEQLRKQFSSTAATDGQCDHSRSAGPQREK